MDEIKKLQEENKKLQEENKRLRKFKEREEEECGASAVMNDFMDRIQELEKENKEIKDRNNKQQVVIVNETIEKEKSKYELDDWKQRAISPEVLEDYLDTIENDFIRPWGENEDWEALRESIEY